MNYNNKPRLKPNYIWVAPLIGAVLALIGFFTPVAYFEAYDGSIYMWMWGLNYIELYGYGSEIIFTKNPDFLIPTLIFSVGTFLSICAFFGSAYTYKKSTKDGRETGHILLGAAIVMIICTIGWMVSIEVVWEGYPSFWDVMDPGFCVFGLFIGSGISITGYAISRKRPLIRRIIILPKKGLPSTSQPSTTHIQKSKTAQIKFCPECGNKVITEDQKFCINCGFNLKNF